MYAPSVLLAGELGVAVVRPTLKHTLTICMRPSEPLHRFSLFYFTGSDNRMNDQGVLLLPTIAAPPQHPHCTPSHAQRQLMPAPGTPPVRLLLGAAGSQSALYPALQL